MKNKRGEKIHFKYNVSTYWSILKDYKWTLFGLMFATLIAGILSIVDKFLFKRIIDDGTKFFAGELVANIFVKTLIIIAIIYAGLVITRTIFDWLQLHILVRLDANLIYNLKRKFFNHILGLDHNFHTTHKTGALISRLGRGAGAVENMTDIVAFNFAPLIFQLIIVGVSIAYFDIVSTIVIIITTIIFVSYSFYIQTIMQDARIKANKAEDFEKGFVGDVFTNVDSIKYFGKEDYIYGRYKKISENLRRLHIKRGNYYRWLEGGQAFILGIGTFFLLYFPIVKFLDGGLSLGTLVFIYTIYGNVVGSMFGFVGGMRAFYRSMADFQDLFEYAKFENEIKDKPNAEKLEVKNGEIEFRNIDFNYEKRKIFGDFNLKIKPNEKIALVGHSGSGKTTLVKLLYRFYDVNNGGIFIDGRNIKDFKQESLRNELSVVPQECVLFDDTVYNNVAFSKPNASSMEIMRAIRFAQLDKVIKNFPKKENTIVGERGVKLSGGEKQRVSIARAILANQKILVLDEATSSLDSETEYEIQKDLLKLLEGRTSIIIAHRLSTIMHADRIIVMKEGKIVQQGKHSELIRQPGEYRKLWNLQKGGYIEE